MTKVRWGVLGAATIATQKVIPALLQSPWCEVVAIASRDRAKASAAAASLGIRRAYGSYEELLGDPDVEAIYNPLPNHLHVPWTTRAAEAGKHVLCEKPIALNAAEAATLIAVRDRTGVHIQEAFMIRTHPQWIAARDLARSGRIGDVRAITGFFSYFNQDPSNIRNVVDYGGGALLDIGCYLINTARYIYGREPARVAGLVRRDPRLGVDTLTSLMLDFETGHAIGTCSTEIGYFQRVQILGALGRIDIEIPFNAPADRPCRIFVDDATDLYGTGIEQVTFETCNQYTIQGDLFSQVVRGLRALDPPLEDAVANMRVIDAIFAEAETRQRPTREAD